MQAHQNIYYSIAGSETYTDGAMLPSPLAVARGQHQSNAAHPRLDHRNLKTEAGAVHPEGSGPNLAPNLKNA